MVKIYAGKGLRLSGTVKTYNNVPAGKTTFIVGRKKGILPFPPKKVIVSGKNKKIFGGGTDTKGQYVKTK